jgi:hypothetical protein
MMRRTRVVAPLLAALALAGCTTAVAGSPLGVEASSGTDRALVTSYFDELNEAGTAGPSRQRDFLRRTQHPDFTDRLCDLNGLTIKIEPAMSTFRADPRWKPEKASSRPRGVVYALGVFVSIRRGGAVLAEQIASQRVVVLDGRVYGFGACPAQ